MLIPRYWAKVTRQAVAPDGRTLQLRTWRGSRTSEAEAQAAAAEASERIAARIAQGGAFPERYSYGDRPLREEVVRCWMGAEAYALETYRTVSRLIAGGRIGAEASLNKIFWSELDIRMHELALQILGDRAELLPEAPAAHGVGSWLDSYLFALSGPIYAGTNEIQRNIVAERILGLPR